MVADALAFPHDWRAEVLTAPPLIAPARQFTYPMQVAGEEDALARGALQLMVHPAAGGSFLATCALGFRDPSMPTGLYACPDPGELCAVAGGYAYVVDTRAPEHSTHIALRPVTEVVVLPEHGLLVFSGFHALLAWGREGVAWQTARLSWEGVLLTGLQSDGRLHGFGWDMRTDKELEFAVDLRTGQHTGGGFQP
jgi:hypothetical protein